MVVNVKHFKPSTKVIETIPDLNSIEIAWSTNNKKD